MIQKVAESEQNHGGVCLSSYDHADTFMKVSLSPSMIPELASPVHTTSPRK